MRHFALLFGTLTATSAFGASQTPALQAYKAVYSDSAFLAASQELNDKGFIYQGDLSTTPVAANCRPDATCDYTFLVTASYIQSASDGGRTEILARVVDVPSVGVVIVHRNVRSAEVSEAISKLK